MRRRTLLGALAAGLAALRLPRAGAAEVEEFAAPGTAQRRLVVYGATDVEPIRAAIRDFQSLHPDVAVRYIDFNTNELYETFLAEAQAGTVGADLLLSSAMDLQVKLVNDGWAATHHSAEAAGIPDWAKWRDQAFGFTFEPAVIAYSTEGLAPEEVPATRFDLLRLLRDHTGRFRGRVATYDITQSGVGYLLATQDALQSSAWGSLVEALGRAEAELVTRTADALDGIAAGRLLIGYNLLGSYAQARVDAGDPVGIVLPKDYTLVISRTAVLPRAARHPETARLFLDYLLSVRGQTVLAHEGRLFAVRPEVGGPNSRIGISHGRIGPLRPITLGPGLMVYLDTMKRARFLAGWRESLR